MHCRWHITHCIAATAHRVWPCWLAIEHQQRQWLWACVAAAATTTAAAAAAAAAACSVCTPHAIASITCPPHTWPCAFSRWPAPHHAAATPAGSLKRGRCFCLPAWLSWLCSCAFGNEIVMNGLHLIHSFACSFGLSSPFLLLLSSPPPSFFFLSSWCGCDDGCRRRHSTRRSRRATSQTSPR